MKQMKPISEAERRRRQEALDVAIASVALEGLTSPKEYDEMARRYIEGEIELDELSEFARKLARTISLK
jgi:tRNA(Ser,Leu) C12 N-acetylase TAN1